MSLRHRITAAYLPRRLEAQARNAPRVPRISVLMHHVDAGDDGARVGDSGGCDARDAQVALPAVVITFDDGYLGNFTCALPILDEFGLPFTLFVATAMVALGTIHW